MGRYCSAYVRACVCACVRVCVCVCVQWIRAAVSRTIVVLIVTIHLRQSKKRQARISKGGNE